jgi:(2S)-methylsuccinyl-CoA dehydrogenase
LRDAHPFLATYPAPAFVASLAETSGVRDLPDDLELVQDTFRAFGNNVVAPRAEHVHEDNGDVPEAIISGLRRDRCVRPVGSGEYGGYSEGAEGEYLGGMVSPPRSCRGRRWASAAR